MKSAPLKLQILKGECIKVIDLEENTWNVQHRCFQWAHWSGGGSWKAERHPACASLHTPSVSATKAIHLMLNVTMRI